MFHPIGLFKKVQCPKQHDCNLQNCIFSHDGAESQNGQLESKTYDPFSAGDPKPPPSKKRKLDSVESTPKIQIDKIDAAIGVSRPSQVPVATRTVKDVEPIPKVKPVSTQHPTTSAHPQQPASAQRPVSPPPKRRQKPIVVEKVEKLIPRPVAQAPAVLKVRMSFIEIFYKQINAVNSQITDAGVESDQAKLNDQQMITWVLDEEQQAAATLASDIYRNAMSQKILQAKKMKVEDWKKILREKFNPSAPQVKDSGEISTGLSPDEESQVLKYLKTNLTGLDSYGYVTKAPSALDIQQAKDTVKATGGYEVCDRCGIRFQVFPGRDEEGRLTTKGECHYHWGKPSRSQYSRTDHITGHAQSSFPCCGQPTGSEGCTRGATHVFKVSDVRRLATLLQFENTPAKHDGRKRGPVAFDCEMAYTTYGSEVVRVTAVSWPQNKELLDILVRPFGEVLDLNTRFSGVTQEQYTKALPYEMAHNNNSSTPEAEVGPQALRKVDSPAAARQLMFDLLAPDTPLIGHAIENDLNTCRMIHPFVVDTILLYPHPKGLPIRYGLKMLASQYLNRSIQTGGDAGHDSKEDSIATGDLVRIKVMEKWQVMKVQGWKFHEGSLLPPGRK